MMDASFPAKQLCTAADYCTLIRVFLKAAQLQMECGPTLGDPQNAIRSLPLFERAQELWEAACESLQHTFVAQNGVLGYQLFVRAMEAAGNANQWKRALEAANKVVGCFNDPEIAPQVCVSNHFDFEFRVILDVCERSGWGRVVSFDGNSIPSLRAGCTLMRKL